MQLPLNHWKFAAGKLPHLGHLQHRSQGTIKERDCTNGDLCCGEGDDGCGSGQVAGSLQTVTFAVGGDDRCGSVQVAGT